MVEAPITRNARVPRQLSWHGGVGYAPNWVSFGLCLWLTTSCGCGLTKCWKEGCEAVADCRELSQQGVEALEREDWQTAESSFSQAIQICPIDPIARRNYCEVLWKRGDRPAALNQLHEAIALRSSDPALHLRLAELSLEMADYDTCYREVNEAIDLEPTLAEAWLLRGKLMWRSGRLNQSMTDLHRALKYDPEQRDTLYLLAEVHRGLNQPQQALNVLYQLAEIYPPGNEPQEVLYLTGLAYMALERYSEAQSTFTLAARRGPESAELLYHLAESQLRCGRPDIARQSILRALEIAPQHNPSQQMQQEIDLALQTPPGAIRR